MTDFDFKYRSFFYVLIKSRLTSESAIPLVKHSNYCSKL